MYPIPISAEINLSAGLMPSPLIIMPTLSLTGRETLLAQVLGWARALAEPGEDNRLLDVYGPAGTGKKTLLRIAREHLEGEAPEILWIWPRGQFKKNEPEEWVEMLYETMEMASPAGAERIHNFLREQHRSLARHRDENAAQRDLPENWTSPPLERAADDFRDTFVLPTQQADTPGIPDRVIFVLPGYEETPDDFKELFTRSFVKPALERRDVVPVGFILAGRQPLVGSHAYHTWWSQLGEGYTQLTVPPFTLEEVKAWLKDQDEPTELAEDLYEISGGLPGRLTEDLISLRDEESQQKWSNQVHETLNGKSGDQRRIICRACYLEECSRDSLCAFYPPEEAREAFNWLFNQRIVPFSRHGESIRVDPRFARILRNWLKEEDPTLDIQSRERAKAYNSIIKLIPRHGDREMLAELAPFEFFNAELIHKVFPLDRDKLLDFIARHPAYFQQGTHNWRMGDQYREAARLYAGLHASPKDREITQAIELAWQERCESARREIAKGKKRITGQKKSLEDLQEELKKVSQSVKTEKKGLEDIRKRRFEGLQRHPVTSKGAGIAVLLQLGGILLLYFSILFFQRSVFIPAGAGIACIFAGLLIQGQKSAAAPTQKRHHVPSEQDMQKAEKNLHFLELKRNQLQANFGLISANIAKQKEEINSLEQILREPYH